jgi:pilus assembly protein FimV
MVEESGFLASLLENPLLLPGAGVLVALLAGLGIYRLRGRLRKQGGETSFLESRLQPDSFFGASGGQRIDTRESSNSSSSSMSSMSYSLSQLDAIGDVDPVAEADVYLAYGRDLQAEEILKEAMRATPERMAIRIKLLEVYLKRRDTKGFELLATQVFSLTRGTGEDWVKAQELGRQIDPENRLYQPGGEPELEVGPGGRVVAPLDATTLPHTAKPAREPFVPAADPPDSLSSSLDVDLDLDIGNAAPTTGNEKTMPLAARASQGDGPLDFDLPPPGVKSSGTAAMANDPMPRTVAIPKKTPPAPESDSLDFDLGDMSLDAPAAPRPADPPPSANAPLDFGDFANSTNEGPVSVFPEGGDPLARKLELAEEFRQIGDLEGARDLLEEVVAKAEGSLRSKAQSMLSSLG